jgi:signal transduction histidine kinase
MRQVSENLGIIIEEGERLTTLINDTLDLAKIEAGRMEWRRDPVDIAEVIARATSATASLLAGPGPGMIVEVIVTGTDRRSRPAHQVVNLISNAVVTPPLDQVHRPACPMAMAFSPSHRHRSRDPAGRCERVFEKFRQVGDTLTDKPHGTGLGLPISRQIVRQFGGELWAESVLGEGATFSFTLPLTGAAGGQ